MKILDCPECETQFEVDEPLEPGDIIPCPDCEGAFLVEEDGSLTPGTVGDDDDTFVKSDLLEDLLEEDEEELGPDPDEEYEED